MVQGLNPQVVGTNAIMTAMASSAVRLIKAILAKQLIIVHVESFLRGQTDITFGTQETFVVVEWQWSAFCTTIVGSCIRNSFINERHCEGSQQPYTS